MITSEEIAMEFSVQINGLKDSVDADRLSLRIEDAIGNLIHEDDIENEEEFEIMVDWVT